MKHLTVGLLLWAMLSTLCMAQEIRSNDWTKHKDGTIDLEVANIPVVEALGLLERASGIRLTFQEPLPHINVSVSLKKVKPEQALKTICDATGLIYQKDNKLSELQAEKAKLAQMEMSHTSNHPRVKDLKRMIQALDRAIVSLESTYILKAQNAGEVHTIEITAPAIAVDTSKGPSLNLTVPTSVAAPVPAPGLMDKMVSLEVKNMPLPEVLQKLGESVGVKIEVDESVSRERKVTAVLKSVDLLSALNTLCQPATRLLWRMVDDRIVVVPLPFVTITGPDGEDITLTPGGGGFGGTMGRFIGGGMPGMMSPGDGGGIATEAVPQAPGIPGGTTAPVAPPPGITPGGAVAPPSAIGPDTIPAVPGAGLGPTTRIRRLAPCARCGKWLQSDWKFCPYCGRSVPRSAPSSRKGATGSRQAPAR